MKVLSNVPYLVDAIDEKMSEDRIMVLRYIPDSELPSSVWVTRLHTEIHFLSLRGSHYTSHYHKLFFTHRTRITIGLSLGPDSRPRLACQSRRLPGHLGRGCRTWSRSGIGEPGDGIGEWAPWALGTLGGTAGPDPSGQALPDQKIFSLRPLQPQNKS